MGCVGVLVTRLWPDTCPEKGLTYKNPLLKAQLGTARTEANFHFIRDAFTFKTSCFESRFLLLNMGLSGGTTAPALYSFGRGYPDLLRKSSEGARRPCGASGVFFSAKVSGADGQTACPLGS